MEGHQTCPLGLYLAGGKRGRYAICKPHAHQGLGWGTWSQPHHYYVSLHPSQPQFLFCECSSRAPGEHSLGPLSSHFYLFCTGSEASGEGLQQNIHQFSRCAFSGLWSPLNDSDRAGGFLTAVGPGVAHLVLLLFWAWS